MTKESGNMADTPKYKRVLLKLSGEALAAGKGGILDNTFIAQVAEVLKRCLDLGVEIGIIVGAGNIWRGRQGKNMDQTRADYMGMLATAINALALQDAFVQSGIDTRVMTAIHMNEVAEPYIRNKAIHHLERGRVVIFGCGLGIPFFSTDTAAVLRAAEICADIVLLAKNVDGVYTADPKLDPNAKKIDSIEYIDILREGLKVLDFTATSFSMENHIPILLFGLDDPENIIKAVNGEKIGTIVGGTK